MCWGCAQAGYNLVSASQGKGKVSGNLMDRQILFRDHHTVLTARQVEQMPGTLAAFVDLGTGMYLMPGVSSTHLAPP